MSKKSSILKNPAFQSIIASILCIVVGLLVFTAALAFSVVLFAVIATVGAAALAFAWWRVKFAGPRAANVRPGEDIIDVPSREIDRGVERLPR